MRTTRIRMLAAGLLVLGLAGIGAAHPTYAAGITYYVAQGGTGTCTTGQSSTTPLGLVQGALDCAASDAPPAGSPDTISIAPGTYFELLTINANVSMVGVAEQTILDGSQVGRVVLVNSGYTIGIRNLTIQHGSSGKGGGIFNAGTMMLRNSTVSANSGYEGGGIFNAGTIMLSNSTVSTNSATYGGGIFNAGTLTLSNSTVSANSATRVGGGIFNAGTMRLSDSPVRNNSAGAGGGIFNDGAMTLSNSSVKGNTATSGSGSGIYNASGTVTLTNSTVSKNIPTTDQCHGC